MRRDDRLPVDELVLLDIDRERLDVVGALADRMMRKVGWTGRLSLSTDRLEAIEGADFVIVQLRVGGNRARYLDETIPLDFGCIGQETTGPGGFAKALRTVPVVLELAQLTAERGAPELGSSISRTRPDSCRRRCSTRGTGRSGCATLRSGSSATSPRSSVLTPVTCGSTTWA